MRSVWLAKITSWGWSIDSGQGERFVDWKNPFIEHRLGRAGLSALTENQFDAVAGKFGPRNDRELRGTVNQRLKMTQCRILS